MRNEVTNSRRIRNERKRRKKRRNKRWKRREETANTFTRAGSVYNEKKE